MSNPTLVRVRPKRRIFANRMSTSLTRSPYSVPGSTRLTVTFGALFANGRPSVVCGDVKTMLAASGEPWSLRNVPDTSTSIFGSVYEPRPVKRVTHPVVVLHHGLVGFCAPSTVYSGAEARASQ